jgi:hypothetical protein
MLHLLRITLTVAAALIVSSCVHPRPAPVTSLYTEAMFVRALGNRSTAPDFVLITVVDARDNSARVVCTGAPFVEGALHQEYDIPYDEAGVRHVHELALKQSDRAFRFSKPEALRNVQASYTEGDLDVVRSMIANKTESELLDYQYVQSIYRSHYSRNKRGRYKGATAHALLERGISCRIGCLVGDLNPYK